MKHFFFMILTLPTLLLGTQIQWYCTPGGLNMTSASQPMDGTFRFELGVFKTGFVPSTDNIDEWSENWIPAQRAVYHAEHSWFTGVVYVEENSPIPQGQKAYIWGFSGDPAQGEWVLCRGDTWVWPSSNHRSPLPVVWNAASANVVVLGDVNDGQLTLRTTTVNNALPPKTRWLQWQKEHLGKTGSGPNEDVNENGIADGVEFVLGIDGDLQLEISGLLIRLAQEGEEEEVELVVPRRGDRPAVFEIEVSRDLKVWLPADQFVNIHSATPSELVFRDKGTSQATQGPWFWRYRITTVE